MNVTPSVTIVRRIKAPPARVFEAWTNPEVLARWFGPHHTRVEFAEVDARPGGGFTVRMAEDNDERHQVSGTYTEFEPGRLLVFSWAWITMPERESRVMVTFRAVPDGTDVTLIHDRFADAQAATNHRRGWTESFERLASVFADAEAD